MLILQMMLHEGQQCLHALGIVGTVNQDASTPLQPCRPHGGCQSLPHGFLRQTETLLPQFFHHSQHRHHVG